MPHTRLEREAMCKKLGIGGPADLLAGLPRCALPDLPEALDEPGLLKHLEELAGQNTVPGDLPCFLGAGAYRHYRPLAVDTIVSRGEFATAYTPYQPEMSQGMLKAIFEFQTLVCRLTGLEAATASHYDGATALAEGVLMACDLAGRGRVLVSRGLHPEYRQVAETYGRHKGLSLEEVPCPGGRTAPEEVLKLAGEGEKPACLVVQNPNFWGVVEDGPALGQAAAKAGVELVAAVAEPVSLALLKPPGAYGAGVAAGELGGLGNHPSYGGPGVGFLAASTRYLRRLPGRLVGETEDKKGRKGYVLTLQAREQHIRRERATSNICSNEALAALASTVYLSLAGPEGLREVARACLGAAAYARKILEKAGFRPLFPGPYFHEFPLDLKRGAGEVQKELRRRGIIGGLPLGRFYPEMNRAMLFCFTELNSRQEITKLALALEEIS